MQLDAMDCGPTCLRIIAKFYGKNYSLQNLRDKCHVSREGVSLLGISDAAETIKEATAKFDALLKFLGRELADTVSEVRFSARLTESPCCLIVEGHALSPHIERLFRAMHQQVPESKRILELNPGHPLIAGLNDLLSSTPDAPELASYARVLLDQALLLEGSPLKDPAGFVKSVTELMLRGVTSLTEKK